MGGSGGAGGVPKQYIAAAVVGFLLLFYVFSSFTAGGDSVNTRGKAAYVSLRPRTHGKGTLPGRTFTHFFLQLQDGPEPMGGLCSFT